MIVGRFPLVAQLALVADPTDGLDCQLDLVFVWPVRICLHPTLDVVRKPLRNLTSATCAEFRGCNRLAAQGGIEELANADCIIDRRRHQRAWIGCFFDEKEPTSRRIVVKGGDAPGVHDRDLTPQPSPAET